MADDNKEAAGQLDIQNQINKVLQQRTAILKNQSKFLSAQTQTAIEMCNALDCEGLDGMKDRLAEIQDGLAEAADEAKNLEGSASSASSSINRMATSGAKKGGLLNKAFSPMGGMFAGLGVGIMSAFKGGMNMLGGFLDSAKRLPGIIGSIGKSLIMLPFSLLNNLTSFAAGAGGGVSALRQAMEDLKETFGSIASNEGKSVMQGFKNIRKQSQSLGGSGVRMARIFGVGQEGLAAAMKSVGEQMTDLGPMMSTFGGEIEKNAGVFEVYRRGLGLTGDNFKALGTLAQTTGKSLESTLDTVGSQAINMGKQFGVSSKLIAGDMASMLGNVANFGTLSIKQVSSLAVYTRKLGIEAKELNSVIDKWDNFEDAAAGASKLSQAFGMNIDAMAMMKEADPGKRMDMMRESFQATGKSVEDLSRQELKLLASQMGLSEEAAKKALSSDLDYDEITAGSEDAEAKTISQAEAMKELADAMKQTFKGGGQGPKTFMEALTQGFERGIMRGKGMRKMFKNIRRSLKETYKFGRKLGKAFVDMFPGIQGMVGGLTKLFDPKRFKAMFARLLGAFKQLFVDLRTDPKGGVETFTAKIKEIFKDFFNGAGGAGEEFMNGLKTFGKTVALLVISMLPMLMKGFAGLIKKLADFIRDPSAFTDAAVGLGDGLQQALSGAWQNVVDTWPILRDAFYDLWDAMKPALGGMWKKMWPFILKAMIFKTILAVAMNMTLGAVWGALFKGFKKLFGGAMSKGAAAGGKDGAKAMKKKGGFINAVKKVIRDIAKLKMGDIMKAMANIAVLIIFIGGSLVALAYALKLAVDQVAGVDNTKLAIMSAVLIGLMFAMLPMSSAALALKAVDFKQMAMAMLKMGVVVLGMGVLVALTSVMIAAIPPLSLTEIGNFFLTLGAILLAAGIAILVAVPVGMLADKFAGQLIPGLLILGAVMVGLGLIGLVVGKMLGSIPNPEGVAAMMNAISAMMITTALMLPVAGMLGVMLMAFPFGTAGVAILLAGFGVLGTLATSMVASLIPAMEKIAGIKVGDPASFKMIVDALLAVIQAIEGFINAVAEVMKALRPGLADLASGKSMEDNIKAATGFVDSVLKGGILPLIATIMDIAKSTNISKSGLEAVKAIGAILNAVGSILKSMQPDPEVIKMVRSMSAWYGSGAATKMMAQINEYMKTAKDSALELLIYIANEFFTEELLRPLRGIDPNAAKVLGAMGPILEGVAGALDAMKPSPEMMETVQRSRGFWGTNQGPEMMDKMTEYMKAMETPIKSLIDAVGDNLVKILEKLTPIITIVGSLKVDPKMLDPIVKLVTGVMTAMGSMMTGIGPAITASKEIAEKFSNSGQSFRMNLTAIGGLMSTMGESFTAMLPSIVTMITKMVAIAKTIKDPDQMVKKVDVIVKAMDVVNIIAQQFSGKTGPLANYAVGDVDSPLQAAHHNMISFNNYMLKPGGPLQTFVDRLSAISIPSGAEKKAESLGKTFCALGVILDGLSKFKEMAPAGTGAGSNDSAALAEINQAITHMQDINFDGIKTLMEKIGAGNWKFSTKKIDYRAKGAEALSEFLLSVNRAGSINIDPYAMGWGQEQAILGTKIVLETVGAGDWKYSTQLIESRKKGVEELANFFRQYNSITPAFRQVISSGLKGNEWCHVYWAIDGTKYTLEYLANSIEPTMQGKFNTAAAATTDMLQNYAELNNLLATIGPLDIEGNLSRFGDSMSISTDTIKIENKPINITVNFNVTMNADDMALSLSTEKNRKNSVQLSKKGGAPVGG